LPRRAIAELAGGRPFFGQLTETGSHPGNLDRIARGEADATVVDNVTYAFWRRYRPDAASRTPILARTPPSPPTPLVTSLPPPAAACPSPLAQTPREPRFARIRGDLLIKDIVPVPDARYRMLLDYEAEAAALGYPHLA